MRSSVRFSFVALLVGVIVAFAAPAAAQAAFGVEKFFAANCKTAACEPADVTTEAFTQAGGHPPAGITDFTVNNHVIQTVPFTAVAPDGLVTHVRTDVAPGVSTNPEAVAKCSEEEFGDKELAPGTGAFAEPKCPTGAVIGENKVVVLVETETKGIFANVPLTGTVYNIEQPTGLSSLFGVALSLEPLGKPGVFAHTLIEGHVEWASDYHDYFEINVSPALPLISSRLVFKGNIGEGEAPIGSGGFLTNPTSCTGIGPQTTSKITLKSEEGATGEGSYEGPVGSENCGAVPFGFGVGPNFGLTPETTQSDAADGITTTVSEGHDLSPTGIDSSQVKSATITLPEGLTINPTAAREVTEACTPAQIGIGTRNEVKCPAASKVGTATLDVPGLPAESLKGTIYLGGENSGKITKPPYTMYVDAESEQYGLSVRLKGTVEPDPVTGQLKIAFGQAPGQPPEQPFSALTLHLDRRTVRATGQPARMRCGG